MDGITLELLALHYRRALSEVAKHKRCCENCKGAIELPKGALFTPLTDAGEEMGFVTITAGDPWDIWRGALKAVATVERATGHKLAAFTLMWVDGQTFKQTCVAPGILTTVAVAIDSHKGNLTSIGEWATTPECDPEAVRRKSIWVSAIEKYFECKSKVVAMPMSPAQIEAELNTIIGYFEKALSAR